MLGGLPVPSRGHRAGIGGAANEQQLCPQALRRAFFLDSNLRPTRRQVLDLDYRQDVLSNDWFWPKVPHGTQELLDENSIDGMSRTSAGCRGRTASARRWSLTVLDRDTPVARIVPYAAEPIDVRRRRRALGAAAIVLVCTATWTSLLAQDPARPVQQDVQALIAQLGDRSDRRTEWIAAARLRAFGTPAIDALVEHLRHDQYDYDHDLSAAMRTLQKIGVPAIEGIDRALTDDLLRGTGTTRDDLGLAFDGIRVLTAIGSEAVPVLLRIALSAGHAGLREQAFRAAGWPSFDAEGEDWPWVACIDASPHHCPFDDEPARLAARLRPRLGDVRDHLARETDPGARLAAAQLLARWGDGTFRAAGESALLAVVAGDGDERLRAQAIRTLGLLRVDAARDVISARASSASVEITAAAASALARLSDARAAPLTLQLMALKDQTPGTSSDGSWIAGIRRDAIASAGRRGDLAFVPALIDLLDRRDWNGTTSIRIVNGSRMRRAGTPLRPRLPEGRCRLRSAGRPRAAARTPRASRGPSGGCTDPARARRA